MAQGSANVGVGPAPKPGETKPGIIGAIGSPGAGPRGGEQIGAGQTGAGQTGWQIGAGVLLAAALLGANFWQPLWVSQALWAWLAVVALLLAATLLLAPRFAALLAAWMTPRQAGVAWALLAAALALRLLGATHPLFDIHDLGFHQPWLTSVMRGELYIFSTPSEFQNREIFNPPAGYLLMAPLQLFLPSVKLVRKDRVGARVRRRYDAPRTPLQRLQTCPAADPATLKRLLEQARTLDPFAVAERVDRGLDRVYRLATFPRGPRKPAASQPATDRPADSPPRSKPNSPVTVVMARRYAAR